MRSYQEKTLNIMCSNGIPGSGIIVLPYDAGKTLTGILVICTIKRNTIIIWNNNVSVQQLYWEINNWVSTKGDKDKKFICRFTSNTSQRDPFWNFSKESGNVITSYTMISYIGQRNKEVQECLDKL